MKTLLPLAAFAGLTVSANAAVVAVVDANNILPTAVTNTDDTSWGRYGRAFSNMYDQEIDTTGDGGGGTASANVIIPTTTTSFILNLDTGYNLAELRAYTGGFDRYASSVKFETSIDGGSNWTDRGTVASGSFVTDSVYSTGYHVASVAGSFAGVDAIQFTIVSVGGEARVGEVMAIVPEPTTTALLGLGGLALILRRRK